MKDIVETTVLALVLGAFLRTLRELHRERELRCADDDDTWPIEQHGHIDERSN